jgi:endonuclease YncB( thermonuclease family)
VRAAAAQAHAARDRLAQLVDGQPLTVTPRYRDRWGRVVADVTTPAGDLAAALMFRVFAPQVV